MVNLIIRASNVDVREVVSIPQFSLDYIVELAKLDSQEVGLCIVQVDGDTHEQRQARYACEVLMEKLPNTLFALLRRSETKFNRESLICKKAELRKRIVSINKKIQQRQREKEELLPQVYIFNDNEGVID